jgi:hypothetical protein
VSLHDILAWEPLEIRAVLRQKKVVVAGDTILAHKQATTSRERLNSINPDIEGLHGLMTPKLDEHVLDNLTTFSSAAEQGPKKHLGGASGTVGTEKNQCRLSHPDGATPH